VLQLLMMMRWTDGTKPASLVLRLTGHVRWYLVAGTSSVLQTLDAWLHR
jgi:hypothetical protein